MERPRPVETGSIASVLEKALSAVHVALYTANYIHNSHNGTADVLHALHEDEQDFLEVVTALLDDPFLRSQKSQLWEMLSETTEPVFSTRCNSLHDAALRIRDLQAAKQVLEAIQKQLQTPAEHFKEIRVHVRWMIRRDMPEVLGVESQSFESPWNEETFIRCLRTRECIGMVAEHDDQVVGFMIYQLQEKLIHLINFAVAPRFRRSGIGNQMIARLRTKLSAERRSRIDVGIRESNLAGQQFLANNDFRNISVLHEFYDDTKEDCYLMQCGPVKSDEDDDQNSAPASVEINSPEDEQTDTVFNPETVHFVRHSGRAAGVCAVDNGLDLEELLETSSPSDSDETSPSVLPTEWVPDMRPWSPDDLSRNDPYDLWGKDDT